MRLGAAAIIGACVVALTALGGCAWGNPDSKYPEYDTGHGPTKSEPPSSVFGEGGLTLLGGDSSKSDSGGGIGVNSYLWRASLDTISFMPLASADPFGGVIITDWYTPPEASDERLKVNIVILGRELRADGVRATVFRQHRDDSGSWADAAVTPDTGVELENAILTRARQLRIASGQ